MSGGFDAFEAMMGPDRGAQDVPAPRQQQHRYVSVLAGPLQRGFSVYAGLGRDARLIARARRPLLAGLVEVDLGGADGFSMETATMAPGAVWDVWDRSRAPIGWVRVRAGFRDRWEADDAYGNACAATVAPFFLRPPEAVVLSTPEGVPALRFTDIGADGRSCAVELLDLADGPFDWRLGAACALLVTVELGARG